MSTFADEVMAAAERSLPQTEGESAVPGLRGPVEVLRDAWGVPHIYAESLDDVYFAQGFVAACERLFQIDFQFRLATGRLAALLGEPALEMDTFARTVGWNRAGRRIARDFWDERSREITRAWWAGVLAGADAMAGAPPAEYVALGATGPELPPMDRAIEELASTAVVMSWWLCGNAETELLRQQIGERLGDDAARMLLPAGASAHGGGLGSNNWVVAGSRTASGKPLLANDPHLAVGMPSIWLECHLSAPGFEVSGVSLPFAPGIPIGHTATTAWGVTNVGGDTQDVFIEQLNDDGTAARFRDGWEPLVMHEEAIDVRGRDEPVIVTAKETRHGPLLDSTVIGVANPRVVPNGSSEPIALQWIGFKEATPPSTLERIASAKTFQEFRYAVRTWVCPGQNFLYADAGGDIGYQCTGSYPIRADGHDGTHPVPGWTGEQEWAGVVPFEELPSILNPADGFLATANERPHDDDYPHLIGTDFSPPFRAKRIRELIESAPDASHTIETFARMQMDTVSIAARELVPTLLATAGSRESAGRPQQILALLSEWDFDIAADSAAACVYEVWTHHIARRWLEPRLDTALFARYYAHRQTGNTFAGEILPVMLATDSAVSPQDLAGALADAVAFLEDALGPDIDTWRWGRIHQARFASILTLIPELADMFSAGPVEIGGDGTTVLATAFEPGTGFGPVIVPSWRQIIDLADPDASVGMNTTGQSGNPASPRYREMVEDWAAGEYHPLPFTRTAIEAVAAERLRLVPLSV